VRSSTSLGVWIQRIMYAGAFGNTPVMYRRREIPASGGSTRSEREALFNGLRGHGGSFSGCYSRVNGDEALYRQMVRRYARERCDVRTYV
jgi:hypothetical protein